MPPNVPLGSWINPAVAGRVLVHCGERGYIAFDGFGDDDEWRTAPIAKEMVIDRQVATSATFFPDGWFALELPDGFALLPSHYTLRNGG
jgi:hypothetical protein